MSNFFMPPQLPISVRRAGRVRRIGTIIALSAIALSACANNAISGVTQVRPLPNTRPDAVFVRTFDVDPNLVRPDPGKLETLTSTIEGKSETDRQASIALEVQQEVANELVQRLQAAGLPAVHTDRPAPDNQNVLIVEGRFETVDAGKRSRRVLIGLGAGKSKLGATVSVLYQQAHQPPSLIESYSTQIDSGRQPGLAEGLGVGAAAGSLAVSAGLGGAMHAHSERTHDQPVNDARRMADAIAKQVEHEGAAQGWLPQAATH
ncbi:DUF4410 domain-containing protein [Paraburkholderia sp. NMBU_R16]|uniref:DUF4410 domain-containing protein n=1 Tax=Paraburkholderia sp. NMBU_R16 TaxID=2698676 RepID=UPI0015669EB3|nr:DUF4410 domain-containing protein [Paraburkholderia sp. NMBU_R16]NRO99132.1 DUF4410 domain-containing protein [Paraburkholderia sp. NMBU_R16]